ncbi:trypsin alpha-4-like [Schistocerca americana]|uniref:trypsin alpha-4-like n=1 Tax=Schistocerca americana TaxID=7009 RepID=UPI001F4F94E4|nr:trypsin alpha-4-like [Schistocerca americana]
MAGIQVAVLCLLLAAQLQLAAPRALRLQVRDHGRIVGGSEASVEDFPWTLALLYAGVQSCGASIIGSQWALTAAHCFVFFPQVEVYSVRAGSSSRGSGGTVLYLAELYEHELHDDTSGDYDITVIRTADPFPLGTNVAVANLPEDGYDPPAGLAVTVTGWGDTETGDTPDTLRKVDISVMDRSACDGISPIGREVTPRMLCAGEAGKSVCYGDSGSPLVSGSTQVGIASWGSNDCEAAGAVYVNVGNLRSWITSISGV